jgi:glycosyltransferase involved in cell wall biosynthesis
LPDELKHDFRTSAEIEIEIEIEMETKPVYWPFSDWSLSGVCSVCENLIRTGFWDKNEIHIFRPIEPSLSPPQDIDVKFFSSRSDYIKFLRQSHGAIIANSYSWRFSHCERLSRHRYIQIIQSHDPYYYFPAKLSLNRWHAIVGVSSKIVDAVSMIGGQAIKIPNGVKSYSFERKSPPEGAIRLLYAGRLVDIQKRVTRLVEIVEGLKNLRVPYEIRILGSGNMESSLRAFFSKSEMLGVVRAEEMKKHYEWAHFFLLPSDFEGESLALLEALHAGCVPVMGPFESDASDQLVSRGLGYRGDVAGMPDYLAAFASNSEAWRKMSEEVRDFFEKSDFRLDAVASGYRNLFRQVLDMAPIVASESVARRIVLRFFTKLLFSRFRGPVTKLALASMNLK